MYLRLACLMLVAFCSMMVMPVSAFFTSTPVNDLIRIGTDRVSEVYYDGNQTYHMYFETNANKGDAPFILPGMTIPYTPPLDHLRYATGEIYLTPEVEFKGMEARYVQDSGSKVPVTNVSYHSGDHKVTWVMDLGLEPKGSFRFPGSPFDLSFWPTNVLKLSFSLQDGLYGDVAPVSKASYKHRIRGHSGEEDAEVAFFLRGVIKSWDQTPRLTKEYFADEAMTSLITTPVAVNTPVWVRYTLENTTNQDIVLTGMVDSMHLTELDNRGAYTSGSALLFDPIGVPLAVGASHVWTGKALITATTPTTTQLF